jgi:hypothetical protein
VELGGQKRDARWHRRGASRAQTWSLDGTDVVLEGGGWPPCDRRARSGVGAALMLAMLRRRRIRPGPWFRLFDAKREARSRAGEDVMAVASCRVAERRTTREPGKCRQGRARSTREKRLVELRSPLSSSYGVVPTRRREAPASGEQDAP